MASVTSANTIINSFFEKANAATAAPTMRMADTGRGPIPLWRVARQDIGRSGISAAETAAHLSRRHGQAGLIFT
jgi:hypothetical protein